MNTSLSACAASSVPHVHCTGTENVAQNPQETVSTARVRLWHFNAVCAHIRHAAAAAAYAVADGAPIATIETAPTCMAGTLCLMYQDLHPPSVMLGGYSRRSTALSQSAESGPHSGCVIASLELLHQLSSFNGEQVWHIS